ncbi:MAG: OmpA family protein [Hyphomicrobiaceae bacterium]
MPETRSQEAVSRLKELLFDREAREIDTLSARMAELQSRAGNEEVFQRSVAQVLDRALKDAETTRHTELADALAPMVLRTLRTEMRSQEMQDQIAGVMYPRMGEMVSRYVASAIRDMMQEINRRLEAGLSQNRFALWLRSVASGRSMAELALAETQRLEISEIYLVRRGSGLLVHHWRRPGSSEPPTGANRDSLVSGFLAAISSLAEEAFEADKESLRTLDLDDHRIYLRGSPDYLLAAKCSGTAPAGVETMLDAELVRVLGDHQEIERRMPAAGGDDEPGRKQERDSLLGGFAGRVEATAQSAAADAAGGAGSGMLKLVAAVVGLPLIGLAVWWGYVSWLTRDVEARSRGALASVVALKGYPVDVHVERGGVRIWLTGLAPDEPARRAVLGAIRAAAPQAKIESALNVLPRLDVDARVGAEGLRRSLDRAQRKLAALVADLAAARTRLPDSPEREPIANTETVARAILAEIEAWGPEKPREQLDEAVRRAVASLRTGAARLAIIAGADAASDERPPQDATDGAEALSTLADRIAGLVVAFEHRRAVAPIARRVDDVGQQAAEIDRKADERVTALDRRLEARIAELERQLAEARPSPPTPRQKLAQLVADNAIFFGNDASYRDAAAAAQVLDAAARLINEAAVAVRVVGYTDEGGTSARNSPLAQARADAVVADLVVRGVPRSLLIPVGRANGANIAPGAGADSPNRRVELEIAFAGEKGGGP